MRNKIMRITTDIYTYETRSITPKECTLEKTPTIKIACHDVTMQDMFERPEYVKELKQLQEMIDNVQWQMAELYRKGLTPTAVLVNRIALHLVKCYPVEGLYVMAFRRQDTKMDTFMGLDVAVVDIEDSESYVRVVV